MVWPPFPDRKKLKAFPSEKRQQMRQELSRPVLEGFWAWVEEIRAKYTANESLKKALTYTTNQRTYLETYLEDGRIPISNNDCKTCIRPFAAGRKAWLFANPPASSRCLFLAMFEFLFHIRLVCWPHYIQSNILVYPPICCVGFSIRSHRYAVENPSCRWANILRSFTGYNAVTTLVYWPYYI